MGRAKIFTLHTVLLALLIFGIVGQAYADNAEQALRGKLEALERSAGGSTEEARLLGEIGAAMQALQGRPVPQEARRRMARGQAAVSAAQDAEGFGRAAEEYQAATVAAPWWADAYYNLGVIADKAGQYDLAMRSLKIYLAAGPDDTAAVEDLIYKIEFRKEEAARAAGEERERQARERRERVRNLAGIWVEQTFTGGKVGVGQVYAETFWELVPQDASAFELAYKSHRRDFGEMIPHITHRYALTLQGRSISGIRYYHPDFTKFGCKTRNISPYQIPISGTLASDGRSMSLTEGGYRRIDPSKCQWESASGGYTIELKKSP